MNHRQELHSEREEEPYQNGKVRDWIKIALAVAVPLLIHLLVRMRMDADRDMRLAETIKELQVDLLYSKADRAHLWQVVTDVNNQREQISEELKVIQSQLQEHMREQRGNNHGRQD